MAQKPRSLFKGQFLSSKGKGGKNLGGLCRRGYSDWQAWLTRSCLLYNMWHSVREMWPTCIRQRAFLERPEWDRFHFSRHAALSQLSWPRDSLLQRNLQLKRNLQLLWHWRGCPRMVLGGNKEKLNTEWRFAELGWVSRQAFSFPVACQPQYDPAIPLLGSCPKEMTSAC
jgi:hypothetical protein